MASSAFKLRIVSDSDAKPATLKLQAEELPPSLRALPRWVGWHWLWRVDKAGQGKWTKPPLKPNGRGHAESTNPATWGTIDEAIALCEKGEADGIGFVLGDGFAGADFDNCRDPQTGTIKPEVEAYLAKFPSYTEVSATGTGVKVVGLGHKPAGFCKRGDVELYDRGRYFALTGWKVRSSPSDVAEITGSLDWLHTELLKPKPSVFILKATFDPDALGDEEIIRRAKEAANGDKFKRLWAGDHSEYARDGNDGRSEADLALCSLLSFWCQKDRHTIDRLFRRSGLMRDKWNERHRHDGATYGEMTIEKGMEGGESYTPRVDEQQQQREAENDEEEQWSLVVDGEIVEEGTPKSFAKLGARSGKNRHRVFEVLSIGSLLAKEFEPPEWCIAGLLADGLNLLVGSPKMGKSMLSLNFALTVAAGGNALGDIRTVPGDVLYLSLEDQQRRVQARASKMVKVIGRGADRRLSVATDWPRMDQGGLGLMEKWIDRVECPRLIIIDVLGRFRPMLRDRGNQYEQDSQHMYAIKQLADEKKVTVQVVHHTRKAKGKKDEAEDEMESISGTQGLAGGADGIILLHRIRHSNLATISMTSRDSQEHKLALEFDKESLTWKSLGDATSREMGRVKQAVLGIYQKNSGSTYWPSEMAELLGMEQGIVRKEMWRMANDGILKKVGSKYCWPVSEVEPSEADSVAF